MIKEYVVEATDKVFRGRSMIQMTVRSMPGTSGPTFSKVFTPGKPVHVCRMHEDVAGDLRQVGYNVTEKEAPGEVDPPVREMGSQNVRKRNRRK